MRENNDTKCEDCVLLGDIKTKRSEPWVQNIKLNGENLEFKVDTGADVTCFSGEMYRPHRDSQLIKPRKKLQRPGNYPLKIRGCFGANLVVKGCSKSQNVYHVSSLLLPLLSSPACEALGLVYRINTVTKTETYFSSIP